MSIISKFKCPDVDAKGMFRWWFPDAGAGADDHDTITEQINSIYHAGFGGVEVALVPHYADFDPSVYGWGTSNWINLMKKVLKAAKGLPEAFKVDFTITAHWPPSLNTIDPNDTAASRELSYAFVKAVTGTGIELPMPVVKTKDRDMKAKADFLFTDTFVAATVAKVVSVNGLNIVLDYGTMKDVSSRTSKIIDSSTGEPRVTKAGIPENSILYGSKPKMDDAQYYWQTDLTPEDLEDGYNPSSGEQIAAGDWLLFGFYHRGTGQTLSGTGMMNFSFPMCDRMYSIDYFGKEGTQAITDYWQKNLLSDPELLQLLQSTKGDIFEDSIETASDGPFWSKDMPGAFISYRNYDLVPYLPFVSAKKAHIMPGFPVPRARNTLHFKSSTGNEGRIQDDFERTLNDLYINNHVKELQNWTKSFHYGYRAQAYGGSIDTSGAATVLDVAEGESLGFGTRYHEFRNVAGGVHMAGRKYVSDEVLADLGKSYALTWKDALGTLNQNYAAGVNRMVIHGTAYETEISRQYDTWPGWHAFQAAFADPWGARHPYWEDVRQLSGYISRNQALLQNGKPRMDIVIYKDHLEYGKGFDRLLDNGYSYDVVSTPSLFLPGSYVEEGVLAPNGPSYRALILNAQESIPVEAAEKLLEYAKAGLPIILYGGVPYRVPGASGHEVQAVSGNKYTDDDLANRIGTLLSFGGVMQVTNEDQLISALRGLGVKPSATYCQPGLLSVRREDNDGTNYYWLFNGCGEAIDTEVALEGKGKPYCLDSWCGSINPVARYSVADGKIVTDLRLEAGEVTIIAISEADTFGEMQNSHVAKSEASVQYVNGQIMLRSDKAGRYTSTRSDGTVLSTVIDRVHECINLDTWDLTIESWGPGTNPARPTIPCKTIIHAGIIMLDTWDKLQISKADLDAANVDSMANVSGVGTYSTTFTLDRSWTGGYGAYMQIKHSDDMVVLLEINGYAVPCINHSTGIIDIGAYLKEGANTIRMKLATTLNNRLKYGNKLFRGEGFPAPPPDMDLPEGASRNGDMPPPPNFSRFRDQKYGITQVLLIPYGQAKLEEEPIHL